MGSPKGFLGMLGIAAIAAGIVACNSAPSSSGAMAAKLENEATLDYAGWQKATDRAVLISANTPIGSSKNSQGLAGYQAWHLVNAKPVYLYSAAFAACINVTPMSPHEGGYINVFVNPKGEAAFLDSRSRVPIGTIVVKEKRGTPDSPPIALTVMTKTADKGVIDDWQFATYSGDAKQRLPDHDPTCRTCHKGANTDHLFRDYLKPRSDVPTAMGQAAPSQ
jgi:hypothetical protein